MLPPQQPLPTESDPNAGPSAPNSALSELQAQLQETQVSLASHVDKIRSLDSLLAEHKVIKSEVTSLRELMEEEKFTQDMTGVSTPTFVTPDVVANAQLQLESVKNAQIFCCT